MFVQAIKSAAVFGTSDSSLQFECQQAVFERRDLNSIVEPVITAEIGIFLDKFHIMFPFYKIGIDRVFAVTEKTASIDGKPVISIGDTEKCVIGEAVFQVRIPAPDDIVRDQADIITQLTEGWRGIVLRKSCTQHQRGRKLITGNDGRGEYPVPRIDFPACGMTPGSPYRQAILQLAIEMIARQLRICLIRENLRLISAVREGIVQVGIECFERKVFTDRKRQPFEILGINYLSYH